MGHPLIRLNACSQGRHRVEQPLDRKSKTQGTHTDGAGRNTRCILEDGHSDAVDDWFVLLVVDPGAPGTGGMQFSKQDRGLDDRTRTQGPRGAAGHGEHSIRTHEALSVVSFNSMCHHSE